MSDRLLPVAAVQCLKTSESVVSRVNVYHLLLPLILFFVLLWQVLPVNGQSVPWQIAADHITHYKQPDSIVAKGQVVLSKLEESSAIPLLTIKADFLRYDIEQSVVTARGNVSMVSADENIMADTVELDLNNQTGILTYATVFLTANKVYIKGTEIIKTGELTYVLYDAWVSACRPEISARSPWAIRSSRTDITVEGMAVLKHATFHLQDVPIIYLPYMMFPVKTKRQTGFLFPALSQSSRHGFGVLTPLFINLSPASDLTFYPEYLSKRGLHSALEFRYAADIGSQGTFVFSYLRDRHRESVADEYRSDGYIRTATNRYWFKGKVDHDFGGNLVARLDIDYVSDRDYLQEFQQSKFGYEEANQEFLDVFNRGFQEKTITSRRSSLQLTKRWSDMILRGDMVLVQDVSGLSLITSPLHTLPRVQFAGRTLLKQTPLSLAWNSEYVHFWREEGIGGHRLDLHPRLIAALPKFGFLEGKISGGLRETFYWVELYGDKALHSFPHDRSQNRTTWDFTGNVATMLMRDFDLTLGSMRGVTHTVRPNLVYNYITPVDQSRLPTRPGDRLTPLNKLTYELNNYFEVDGVDVHGRPYSRNLGHFHISQSYDIMEARRELSGIHDKRRVLSDLEFELLLSPLERLQLKYTTSWNVYGEGITKYELHTNYTSLRGDSLSIEYQYKRDVMHNFKGSMQAKLSSEITVYGSLMKDLDSDRIVESSLGVKYKPHCWMVQIETTKRVDDYRFMIMFSLDGIGSAFEWARDLEF